MAETAYTIGYNEYLDRSQWSQDEPLSGSQKIYSLGNDIVTATGGLSLPLTTTSVGAGSAGQIPQFNGAGIFDSSLYSNVTVFSGVAGENLLANDALYIKADGKLYRAYASTGNQIAPSHNFCGFAAGDAVAGESVGLNAGPVVDGFSGLQPGKTYYLADTTNKGDIVTAAGSTIFGGTGKDHGHPIGLALSTTELLCFYGSAGFFWHNGISFTMPVIGGTALATLSPGFAPTYIWGTVYMEASDSTGGNTTKALWEFIARESSPNYIYTQVNGAGTTTIGTATSMTVEPSGGTNRSILTFDFDSGTDTSIIFSLTNATSAGSGSANGACKALIHCIQ